MIMVESCQDFCQYNFTDLASATLPDSRRALPLRRLWWELKRYAWYARVLGPVRFLGKMSSSGTKGRRLSPHEPENPTTDATHLNLQPGDLVEVHSEKEIFATLDREGKLRGLRFTAEMRNYCGEEFRVYKRVRKIFVETTGEMRTIRSPTVLLEGVICDGSAHSGCDKACFCF
jgi:hypothetical protein